jgi:hypothetical protein
MPSDARDPPRRICCVCCSLAQPVQELLMRGEIDMGHARALLPLSGALQVQLAQRVVQKGLSVRETERLVQHALKATERASTPSKPDRDVLRLQEELSDSARCAGGKYAPIKRRRQGADRVRRPRSARRHFAAPAPLMRRTMGAFHCSSPILAAGQILSRNSNFFAVAV